MMENERAKAAVDLLPKIEAALYGKNDLTNGDVASIVATLELLRPIAAGTHVIVPIEPTPKMIAASWKLVRDRWPRGQFLGEGPAFKECMITMIAASQENE